MQNQFKKDKIKNTQCKKIAGFTIALSLVSMAFWLTPAYTFLRPESLLGQIDRFPPSPTTFLFFQLLYCLGTVVFFPVVVLTLGCSLVFPLWLSLICAISGTALAITSGYLVGRLGAKKNSKLNNSANGRNIIKKIKSNGGWAMVALRLAPTPPFTVTSMIAGALAIPFKPYFIGSLIGALPILLLTQLFGKQLLVAIQRPSSMAILTLIAIGILFIGLNINRNKELEGEIQQVEKEIP